MNPPLRVLHLEDNSTDAELVRATLEAEAIQSTLKRVETEPDFVAALKEGDFDVILADYTLPSFDGLSALKIARERSPEIPFLFVSGTLGEDVAIEALKAGATDYVLKTRLSRLGPSLKRALREAERQIELNRAEAAARRSEKELRDLIATMPTMAFSTRADGSNEFVTPGWVHYSGSSPKSTTDPKWQTTVHPDDLELHRTKWKAALASGEPFENEVRHRSAQGEYRWFLVRAVPLRDEQGEIAKWYGTLTDIEDRKRAEALLAGEKRVLEMVAKGDSLPQILDRLCRLVEEQASEVLASILLLEGNRLRHGAAPSLPKSYTDAIDGLLIGPCTGSCGTAAYRGEQVLVEDIATDPLWADYRDLALPHSLRACWSTPIFSSQGKTIATFAMYYREPRRPSSRDQTMIEQITHLAGVAIERKLIQETLKQSESYLAEAQRLSHTGSWASATDHIRYWSEETFRLLGFDPAARPPRFDEFLQRLHPDDQPRLRQVYFDAIRDKVDFEADYRVVHPNGMTRNIHVVGHPVCDETGSLVELVGTVIDVTERKRSEEALRRSEAYLEEAQRLSHTGSWAWDVDSEIATHWSEENYRIWGFDPRQGPPSAQTALQRVHPDDRERVLAESRERRYRADDYTATFRIMLPDGTVKHLEASSHTVFGPGGEAIQSIGTHVDVTERKLAEAFLAGEKRLLEMIATGVPLKEIMNALCLMIEEQRPGTLASVLLLNLDGIHLDVIAGPNLTPDWMQQMERLPIGPCAGSCGTAAFRGERVIVSDIATDPLWEVPVHRAAALDHHLRASWSNPVLSSKGKVLGTFCLYSNEPRTPSSHDLELLEFATHLVRVAIERDRAEEALRASEQVARGQVETLTYSLDVLATAPAPEKFIGAMLNTIGRRLHAHRVMLWLHNQEDDSLKLHISIDGEQQVPPDLDSPFVKDSRAWKRNPLFQEVLFTKTPVACEDVERDTRLMPQHRDYLIKKGCKRFLVIPMFVLGEVRGFISIQHTEGASYRAEEIELAQALAHQAMLAMELNQFAEERRQSAILEERTRMARDIHDTLAQGFTGVVLQMEAAEEALLEEDSNYAVQHVRRARELARAGLNEARRSVHALRPQALQDAGFADALEATIKNTTAGTSLRTDFELEGKPRDLEPAVEDNLLHIGQEALSNALKHAHASEFQARLSFDSDAVRLELRDNGAGFVVGTANGGGIGLIGMKERADQIGATLTITSAPGAGTKIIAVSPYQ